MISIVIGECKFPFSYKRKQYHDYFRWKRSRCPTSLKGNNLMKTWGYCLPEGIKTYASKLKDQGFKNSENNSGDASRDSEEYNNWVAEYFNDDKFEAEAGSMSKNGTSLFELINKTFKRFFQYYRNARNILSEHNDETSKNYKKYIKLFLKYQKILLGKEDERICENYINRF